MNDETAEEILAAEILAAAREAETCSHCQKRVPVGELEMIGRGKGGTRYRLCKVCIQDWSYRWDSCSRYGPLFKVWTKQ